MPRMKTHSSFATVIAVFAMALPALAVDSGASARQGSLFNGDSGDRVEAVYEGGPRPLSISISSQYQKRGVVYGDSDFTTEWSVRHLYSSIGYDIRPWLTVEGGIGQSDLSSDGDTRDSDLEWMGGLQFRLMDYMLVEPPIGDDTYWFGLDGHVQYTGSQSEGGQGDIDWAEWFGSLTASLTTRPERYGFMDRITLYFGPAYSMIRGKESGGFGRDIEEDQAIGFIGGLVFVPSDNISIKLEAQQFDETSIGASIGFHF